MNLEDSEGKPKVLFVVPVPPWPTVTGGRTRASQMAAEFSAHFDTLTAFPIRQPYEPTESLRTAALDSWVIPSRAEKLGRWLNGTHCMDNAVTWSPEATAELAAVAHDFRPDYTVWFGSPAHTEGIAEDSKTIVSFEDIEEVRQLSNFRNGTGRNRGKSLIEHLTARRWERRLARSADLCVALSRADTSFLSRRSRSVVRAANGITPRPYRPSETHSIVSVAAWDYPPNRAGIEKFLKNDWPKIRQSVPNAQLHLVGPNAAEMVDELEISPIQANVIAHGYVEDLDPLFAESALALAPAESGGGSQLKLFDAIARGRVTVGPKHLDRELQDDMRSFVLPTSDLADMITHLLDATEERHRREAEATAYSTSHSWSSQLSELVSWIQDDYLRKRS